MQSLYVKRLVSSPVVLGTALGITTALSANAFEALLGETNPPVVGYFKLLAGLLIAPFVETLVFQALPYALLKRFDCLSLPLYLAAGSLPFAAAHAGYGNWPLVVVTLVGGACLSALFYYFSSVRGRGGVVAVTQAHFVHNLTAIFYLVHWGGASLV